jgi:hypothetical protein
MSEQSSPSWHMAAKGKWTPNMISINVFCYDCVFQIVNSVCASGAGGATLTSESKVRFVSTLALYRTQTLSLIITRLVASCNGHTLALWTVSDICMVNLVGSRDTSPWELRCRIDARSNPVARPMPNVRVVLIANAGRLGGARFGTVGLGRQ